MILTRLRITRTNRVVVTNFLQGIEDFVLCNELETNSKNKNIRDLYRSITYFKKGYKPRTNMIKDEKRDLVTDSQSMLARWRNHFSQLLNVHGVNDARLIGVHTAEPLVPEPSAFEVEMGIEKLKSHRSPGVGQIPAELIIAWGRTIWSEIPKLIISTKTLITNKCTKRVLSSIMTHSYMF
jgi:hypothetical protein